MGFKADFGRCVMKRFVFTVLLLCFMLGSLPVSALSTSASAAIIINADTGEVIYSQNSRSRLSMASTTKIMTALILAEENTPEKKVKVTREMVTVEGSSMGLLPGDTVSYNDLLYGMLLASGNDAANTTAICVAGSVEAFVERMNKKAQELGLCDTSFVTPSGLDAAEHYTTAHDLAILTMYALKNEDFAKAAATRSATLCYGNPPYKRTLTNHNKLLGSFEGAIGVKTGFTKKSGRCLVSAAQRDGVRAIAVTLNDPDDWQDHKRMLEYGLEHIEKTELLPPENIGSIRVEGSDTERIRLEFEGVSIGLCSTQDIECRVVLPEFVYAPVRKNSTLGRVEYYLNGLLLCSGEIKAAETARISEVDMKKRFLDCLLYIISMV